jgi:hypothetical protein
LSNRTLFNLTIVAGLLAATPIACARPVPAPAPGPAGIEMWDRNHPEASRELGVWAREHRDAARKFFEWDGHHPERSHEFVTWAINHPGEGIRAFAATHPRWEYFDDIARDHVPAANEFMGWCRRHPQAAEALMNHPRGLEWAGHHLYGI